MITKALSHITLNHNKTQWTCCPVDHKSNLAPFFLDMLFIRLIDDVGVIFTEPKVYNDRNCEKILCPYSLSHMPQPGYSCGEIKQCNAIDICRDQNLCTDSLSTENSTAQQKHNLNLKSNQFGNLGINIFSWAWLLKLLAAYFPSFHNLMHAELHHCRELEIFSLSGNFKLAKFTQRSQKTARNNRMIVMAWTCFYRKWPHL